MAPPKKPASKGKKGLEIGQSGTQIFGGIINEEYNPTLSGVAAMKVYDEMRRSDATVKAALLAIQLPIRRAQWFVKPGGETEQDQAIADFISAALFDYQSITWDDFLRQALLHTAFGTMVFEKVFQVKTVEGQERICWAKFAPRLPKSILLWETKNEKPGIQQTTLEGADASIPMKKLLVFVNEKEGDDWWGISFLRAAYKHWYIKSNLEKIDAIAHERQGLGIPFVKLSGNATQDDITKAETILKNMRAHDQGFLVEPEGISVDFKDMHSGSTKNADKSIAYHNREITLAVMAQFLDLGSGNTGSRALSEDHTNLFLHSIEAVANNVVDVINKFAIRELCDLNFDGVEFYPELDYTGIQRTDVQELSVAYQRLVQSGGIRPQESDERYLREVMGLPEKEEGAESAEPEDTEIEEEAEDLGLSEQLGKKKVERESVVSAIEAKLNDMPLAGQLQFVSIRLEKANRIKKHKELFDEVRAHLNSRRDELRRLVYIENAEFDAFRELTFAEKKVNFQNINDFMDREEIALIEKSDRVLIDAKDKYVSSLTKAVQKGDAKRVKELEVRFRTEYTALLKESILKSYEFGKNNAAREMGVKTPGNPSDITKSIDIQANAIADAHTAKITNEAKQVLTNNINKGKNVAETMGLIDAALVKTIQKITKDTSAVVVAGYINTGRDRVFRKFPDQIYALQRSEILDAVTCNFCLSIDGRIVDLDDDIARVGIFHSNCRGIWVEILEAEEDKPAISGIPNSIRDKVGNATNELTQPKKPIVKKSSPAAKEIAKGDAGQ